MMHEVRAFVVATAEGKYPAVPRENPTALDEDALFCKRYKPDEKWREFELIQLVITGSGKGGRILVPGVARSVESTLSRNLLERHEDALLALGFYKFEQKRLTHEEVKC